uniref:aldolase/citrate lyase family protein n=1 Tax=Blastomonas sp. UPD001 TaxID=2217673 RepID=UPI001E4EB287
PHIRSAGDAAEAVRAAHYGPGGRGYAGSSRAAGYGLTPMAQHRAASAARTCVIAQIEDVDALETIDAIAAVPGVDALFVGRIDLTVALDAATPDAPEVIAATERIVAAARAAGRPCGMFVPGNGDVTGWRARGASLFLQSSDHAMMRSGAALLRAACTG